MKVKNGYLQKLVKCNEEGRRLQIAERFQAVLDEEADWYKARIDRLETELKSLREWSGRAEEVIVAVQCMGVSEIVQSETGVSLEGLVQ